MNFKTLLVAVVGGATLWRWAGKRKRRQQQLAQARTQPAELRTWEAEGGAPLDPDGKLPRAFPR